jgi:hypothetical protein
VSPDAQWLHLSTSNIRPLYVQDAVEVLGSAAGDRRTFRYSGAYVPPELHATWAGNCLVDSRVVIHFALQHPAELHDPVFVTLRSGTVLSSRRDGDTFTVTFRLDGLLPPPQERERLGMDSSNIRARAEHVKLHTKALTQLLSDRTPESNHHAVLGPDPRGLATLAREGSEDAKPGTAFETIVHYLAPALFAPKYLYLRVAELVGEDGDAAGSRADGSRKVTGGHYLNLRLHHFQVEQPPDGTRVTITVPEGLTPLSPVELKIGSRYDVVDIKLFAPHRDAPSAGELVVAVEGPLQGPVLRIPVVVEPGVADGLVTPIFGLGAAALAVVPAIYDNWSTGTRLSVSVAAVLLGGYVALHRRGRGLS